jgi:type IV secretory pathway TraG/TraD family ATPase VirD4
MPDSSRASDDAAFDEAARIAQALIVVQATGPDAHFTAAARNLWAALLLNESKLKED